MQSTQLPRLIQFLNDELAIPTSSIDLAMRYHCEPPSLKIDAGMQDGPDAQRNFHFPHCEQSFMASNLLPMILWQYGLITLEQLDLIFDWLETRRNYETINYEL